MAPPNGTTAATAISNDQSAGADLAPSDLDADDQTLLSPPVQWSADLVKAIHKAVHEETIRTTIGALFLPHSRVHPKTTSVRPDLVVPAALDSTSTTEPTPGQPAIFTLLIDEGITIRLNEIWVEFALTDQQVTEIRELQDVQYSTVLTLARRAAQYVGLAVDCVIQNGVNAYNSPNSPAFFSEYVRWRPGQLPSDGGLLNLTLPAWGKTLTATSPYTLFYGPNATTLSSSTNPFISADTPAPIIVNPVSYTNPSPPAGVIWGENTFPAVAQGIANLTSAGKSGPFALLLHYVPFGDLYAPVGTESLAITADRVDPLCKVGVFSSGTLPANPPSTAANNSLLATYAAAYLKAFTSNTAPPTPVPPGAYTGVLVSVGGCSVELVVGQHARTRWQQKDANGNHRFRVMHRFTLKVSDPGSIQPLVFMPNVAS
jgi:hypothetical protein